jgi:hypothetical protein
LPNAGQDHRKDNGDDGDRRHEGHSNEPAAFALIDGQLRVHAQP